MCTRRSPASSTRPDRRDAVRRARAAESQLRCRLRMRHGLARRPGSCFTPAMKRWVVVLMTILAALDAAPVRALAAAPSRHAGMSCSCVGVCRCLDCPVHHPNASRAGTPASRKPATPPGVCVMNCAGCPGSPVSVTPPAAALYDVPVYLHRAGMVPLVGALEPDALRPPAAQRRSLDRPPRPTAA